MKLSKKLEVPPSSPLEPPLWRYHFSVTYVTRQWSDTSHNNFSKRLVCSDSGEKNQTGYRPPMVQLFSGIFFQSNWLILFQRS